ncbi:Checkpoint serine/threonine-protein kinase bub1 [Leucoagaricus sp. SymC.cos]|nr:Checkpoint serine/threonine-protein kinase bub1 [Leucoagaricus sp. SymC.cos]
MKKRSSISSTSSRLSSVSASTDERELQRQQFRKQLDTAIEEEEDPLAVYHQFVQWTIKNYGENDPKSGLIQLLEEATRKFKNDPSYKTDLRYLKLWTLYAKHCERHGALSIYKYLMTNEVGVSYSLLYEEYANALELEGRKQDADTIYRRGIKKQVRPLERLKSKYKEFQSRVNAPSSAPPSSRTTANSSKTPSVAASNVISTSSTAASRYTLMLAPPAPGKRPEKLRFNFGLLFSDGIEYSIQEARARSMGLLGKKWGPPPASERPYSTSSAQVDFNDDGLKSTKNTTRRKSLMGGTEPTVTINTKEALADVFGMYNSPEKTKIIPGSKHAPVKKIDPVTPVVPPQLTFARENENVNAKTPSTFHPFVDENAQPDRVTPGAKFTPFVDPDAHKTPSVTPRPALGAKDIETPVARSENPKATFKPSSKAGDKPTGAVFSKVFAPAANGTKAASHRDVLATGEAKKEKPRSGAFTPIAEESAKTPFKVFSRPGEANEGGTVQAHNAFTPKTPNAAFTPFVDKTPAFTPFRDSQQAPAPLADKTPTAAPLGGRFGQFNVMTPITERTCEYTLSTTPKEPYYESAESAEGSGSPRSSVFIPPQQIGEREALMKAERLAAELREEDEEQAEVEEDDGDIYEQDQQPHREDHAIAVLEERIASLSLAEKLSLSQSIHFSNPCNPFEPTVLSSLLSRIPSDAQFHDLRDQMSSQLDVLEKFAKKSRKASDASNNGVDLSAYALTLDGHRFMVSEKLGEGGFGSVFKARDLGKRSATENDGDEDDDFDIDEDLDDDDESSSLVAVKVVKPCNTWEYHVLRRLHTSLSSSLRRSLVLPHALYAYADESFLILDLCPQGMLLNIINNAISAGVSQQGACLDELLVMFFSIELVRFVEGIHHAGFIHGDLKIDNCLLRLEDIPGGASAWNAMYQPSGEGGWSYKGLKVIDFGRTIDTKMFPSGQEYLTDWATDERDCFEMREGKPWTYQTDYFGLAGIIYCMLFGKYTQESSIALVSNSPTKRYKINTPLKRYWQGDIWNRLFDALLNPCLVKPNGALPICDELAVIRKDMEAWLQANCNRSSNTLKGLLKKVEKSCYTT